MPLRGAMILAALLAGPGIAAADSGAEAFGRRDFATARELWLEEAKSGDPAAQLGLGALSDLGLGVPRDPERAFRHYLAAADAGLAEAQFNVAVMLDSGTVEAGNAGAAALWYGRAAANGYARAEYNLGIMYETGEGVDRNVDLARVWMRRAGTVIEAANDRLSDLGPGIAPTFEAPTILGGFRVGSGGSDRAELVWTAALAEPGAGFLVQLMILPKDGAGPGTVLQGIETEASAVAVPLPDAEARYAWRVARLDRDGRRYATTPWSPLDAGSGVADLPDAFVAFRIDPGDDDARRLAETLGRGLAANRIWSVVEDDAGDAEESSVVYTFDDDRPLAANVANFLPALSGDEVRKAEFIGADPRPGGIVVRLVGGLSNS